MHWHWNPLGLTGSLGIPPMSREKSAADTQTLGMSQGG